jgi:hypothetical protein
MRIIFLFLFGACLLNCFSCKKSNSDNSNTVRYEVISASGNWTAEYYIFAYGFGATSQLYGNVNSNEWNYTFTVPKDSSMKLYVSIATALGSDQLGMYIFVNEKLVATNPPTAYEVQYFLKKE